MAQKVGTNIRHFSRCVDRDPNPRIPFGLPAPRVGRADKLLAGAMVAAWLFVVAFGDLFGWAW